MGADFLVAYCRWPSVIRGGWVRVPEMLNEEELAVLHSRVDELEVQVLREVADWWREGEEPEAAGRVFLHRAIDEVIASPGRRDMAICDLGGRHWVLTGGLSRGEDPTEAMPYVAALALAGVTEEPIEAQGHSQR